MNKPYAVVVKNYYRYYNDNFGTFKFDNYIQLGTIVKCDHQYKIVNTIEKSIFAHDLLKDNLMFFDTIEECEEFSKHFMKQIDSLKDILQQEIKLF